MDINELERLMIDEGLVIRAIPLKIREIYEVRHKDKYPDGRIEYLAEYKRKMLIVEREPENAGKFLITRGWGTLSTVKFQNDPYFDTIEEAVNYLQE